LDLTRRSIPLGASITGLPLTVMSARRGSNISSSAKRIYALGFFSVARQNAHLNPGSSPVGNVEGVMFSELSPKAGAQEMRLIATNRLMIW